VYAVYLEVARDVKLVLGNGISDTDFHQSTILGKFLYRAGANDDELEIDFCRIARGAAISTGAGLDDCEFIDTNFAAAFACNTGADNDDVNFENCELNGSVRIVAGAGDDDVELLAGTNAHGLLDIRTSSGDDTIKVSDALVGGRFLADTGAGDDVVAIAQNSSDAVIFEGAAAFRMGAGTDSLGLGMIFDILAFAHFRAPVVFDGGAGADIIGRQFSGNIYTEGFTEISFETVN